jgi:predicted dehydrogenase
MATSQVLLAQCTRLTYAAQRVTMRLGLIGTGDWATNVHAPSLAEHPGVEFVGLWGRDQARTAAMSGRFGIQAYADPERLIEDVDALAFAVPPAVQADLAVRAAQRGRHVLLEKPVATSVLDARRLEHAVAGADVASIVFFTWRFVAQTQAWLEHVGQLGGWLCGRAEIAFNIYVEDGPQAASLWRHEYGALWDLGPHALSLLVPVLGEVTAVVAGAGRGDQVHLIMQHTEGRASSTSLTLTAPSAATGTCVYFDGECGRETLSPRSLDLIHVLAAHRAALDALIDRAGHPNRSHPCDVHRGARVVEVLHAAQQSLSSGCRVEVPPYRGVDRPPCS